MYVLNEWSLSALNNLPHDEKSWLNYYPSGGVRISIVTIEIGKYFNRFWP